MVAQPLVLYAALSGPNSWKCTIVLKELGIPYKMEAIDYSVLHQKPYTDINPNGRAPALHDPNTDVTIWESCAINDYLVTTYDTSHTISQSTSPEKWLEKQYVFYQASGQGPYFGQAAWFRNYHPESLPSAKERYSKEVERVVGVLDGILANKKYLVGDKLTWADLSYVMWNYFIEMSCVDKDSWDGGSKFPNFKRWQEEMMERESVKESLAERESSMGAH